MSCSKAEVKTSNRLTFNTSRLNMSHYGNFNISGTHGMDREDEEEMHIYSNEDTTNSPNVRTQKENSDTKRHQTPRPTESDYVKSRGCRASTAYLVLLCVLLLTAGVVLCVHINTSCTAERDELLAKIANLTEERDQLISNNMQLTKERDGLSSDNHNLTKQRDQLKQEKNKLSKMEGWVYYQSSLYFISCLKKSWAESRKDCTRRGGDLMIINSKEEQDIASKLSCDDEVWIGLTDDDVENRWKWVDGSTLTSGFWRSEEPNGGTNENCALTRGIGWIDHRCHEAYRWICEKKSD